jgi:hypothetical protein
MREQFVPVKVIADELSAHDAVYIVDCTWELFILVERDARGKRADIRLALTAAQVRQAITLRGVCCCLTISRSSGNIEPVGCRAAVRAASPCRGAPFPASA